MIEIITAIVTQTVVLKMDIVLTIDNYLTFNHKTTVVTLQDSKERGEDGILAKSGRDI